MQTTYKRALIVGAGDGLSASLARLFHRQGLTRIALAARNVGKLEALIESLGPSACAIPCDASIPSQVDGLFGQLDRTFGAPPDVVVYNASARMRKAFVELSPDDVARALNVSAYGGFLVAQAASKRMLTLGKGAILFTGASASVKGYPLSAPFALGKFALRGLAQSMARELAPKGIHVAHFVIDGSAIPERRNRLMPPTACWIPMPSPGPICTPFVRIGAPGHGKSNLGRGWNLYDGSDTRRSESDENDLIIAATQHMTLRVR